jgi:hypothetical protein
MFTNKSKIMNAGNFHSDMNNPDLVRQQLIQLVCRLTSSKFETKRVGFEPSCFTWGFRLVFGNKVYGKKLYRIVIEDHHTIKEMF